MHTVVVKLAQRTVDELRKEAASFVSNRHLVEVPTPDGWNADPDVVFYETPNRKYRVFGNPDDEDFPWQLYGLLDDHSEGPLLSYAETLAELMTYNARPGGSALQAAPRERTKDQVLEEMYDLYHKQRTPEEQARMDGLVKEHGKPRYMANRRNTMTEKQASAWVDMNCRFAAMQNSRSAVRTAAAQAGVELTDEQADFHVVKAAVLSSLKTAGAADELAQLVPGQDMDALIEAAVAKSGQNVVAATTEVLNKIKEIGESMKRTRPDFVIPTLGYDAIRKINQAVREYLQTADPAELFNRQKAMNPAKVGPNVAEPRARLNMPQPTSGRAPITQPNPHNRPIPRQPALNPLPA